MAKGLPDGTKPKRMAKQRKCLKCDHEFEPRSVVNRLCIPCKGVNENIADVEIQLPIAIWKKLTLSSKRHNWGG